MKPNKRACTGILAGVRDLDAEHPRKGYGKRIRYRDKPVWFSYSDMDAVEKSERLQGVLKFLSGLFIELDMTPVSQEHARTRTDVK